MRLIIFDLDHTLLKVNSSFHFGAFLYRNHYFSFWTLLGCLSDYFRHKWMSMPIHELHEKTFSRIFKEKSLKEIRTYVSRFLSESFEKMIYLPVLQRLKKAQAEGDYVVILSSASDFIVEPIAERLQVQDWKATVYEADSQGKLKMISQIMEGEDKANYLRELSNTLKVSHSAITVYSDSYLDLPLLKMAGEAIGVVPDFRLRKICLKNGWEIL